MRSGTSRREGQSISLPRRASWPDKSDILIFILGTAFIVSAAWLTIQRDYLATLDLWRSRLSAAVQHQAWTLRVSLQQSQDDAQVLAGYAATRQLLQRPSAAGRAKLVSALFSDFQEVYEYAAVTLFDEKQKTIVQVTGNQQQWPSIAASSDFQQIFRTALHEASYRVKLVRGRDKTLFLLFAMPVLAEGKATPRRPLGVVTMFDGFAQDLLPLLSNKDLPLKTVETPLVQLHDDGSGAGAPRYVTGPAAAGIVSSTDTLRAAAWHAVEERAIFGQFIDYRGAPVMAAMEKIPALDSVLILKVSSEEVLADFKRTAQVETYAAIALTLAYAAVILVFKVRRVAREMQNQLTREHHVNENLESTVARRTRQLAQSNLKLSIELRERERAERETRELNAELEQRVQNRTIELQSANKELASFAYSVSHDLRAPLRGIDGWSQALREDYGGQLDATGQQYLARVLNETRRMGHLIDDMLLLSRLSQDEMNADPVDLSALALRLAEVLREAHPRRVLQFEIAANLEVAGDARLLEIALTNLFSNAVKFTSQRATAVIEFGSKEEEGELAFFVRDNGAGFDMKYAASIFGAFQRLHSDREFHGTGIGLAIVQRVVARHGGRVWAEARVNEGATFWFTLPAISHSPFEASSAHA